MEEKTPEETLQSFETYHRHIESKLTLNKFYYRLSPSPAQNRVLLPRTTITNIGLIKLEDITESEKEVEQKHLISLMELL